MRTVLEILSLSTDHLKKHGVRGARRQAEEILSGSLKVSRTQLYMEHDRPLTEAELEVCRSCLSRRAKGEPLAYILGFVDFLDCRIDVTPSVLIPRQETEILADIIVKEIANEEIDGKAFVDLCCGSGCLGIAIKKQYPNLNVILSDISQEALQQAKKNAEMNSVDVEFVQGDFLQPLVGRQAHYLVCNPPYIAEEDYPHISHEVRDYEPRLALVAPQRGLAFYHRLNTELPQILAPNGKVWLEIGFDQGEEVKELFSNQNYINIQILPDWSGKDRFCTFQRNNC